MKPEIDQNELGDLTQIYVRYNSPTIGPRRYIGASDQSMHVMMHDVDYINWFLISKTQRLLPERAAWR
jgi:predicted dehydrogenase